MDLDGITGCYHCGLPLSPNDDFQLEVLGKNREVCCPGCLAVSEAIIANGLEDYYRFRTELAVKGDEYLSDTLEKLDVFDDKEVQQEFIVEHGDLQQIQLTIEGISCAACGWLIEKQLSKIEGISQIGVNVAARRATLSWSDRIIKLSQILKLIEKIGYHALPFQPDKHEASYQNENKSFLKKLGLSGLMTMQVMMLAIGLYFGLFGYIEAQTKEYFHWISLVLTTPVVLYSGSGFYISAVHSARLKTLNMDVSISIAIWGTYLSSVWATVSGTGTIYFESVCMFIFLLLISRYLEHRSRHQAALMSANMLKYIPVTANLFLQGVSKSILARKLQVGDLIVVKAGETIPVDGNITEGSSLVDESMLTGEFEPVNKNIGQNVFGGTVNKSGILLIKVEKVLKDALVNQIIRMQELALSEKPRAAQFADRASSHFVTVVLVIAGISYGFWFFHDSDRAFWIAIAVLVATCPCALGLATPSALTSAMAKLNQHGVLIKRSDVLDSIPDVDMLAMDKTGTLTEGKFNIQRIICLGDTTESDILVIASSLEHFSEHPIAKAFDSNHLKKVSNIRVVAGEGIEGMIEGQLYRIGSAKFVESEVAESLSWASVFLESNQQLLAAISLDDNIRSEVPELLKTLKALNMLLLSGDNQRNVKDIATQLGIKRWFAAQSPAQKLQRIKELRNSGHRVMMLGDGINDAPVLAAADVSIAVGNATDIAKRSADVIILGTTLTNLPLIFVMAKRTRRKIRQNMSWAIGYNILILPLAVSGYLTPWMAVIGMSVSSLIVVSNSVKLLK